MPLTAAKSSAVQPQPWRSSASRSDAATARILRPHETRHLTEKPVEIFELCMTEASSMITARTRIHISDHNDETS
jgi:hypothetical protein